MDPDLRSARRAVAAVFALNGFAFATWMSRMPDVRHLLDLTPGELGRLLLALSLGAVLGLPSAGRAVGRWGPARTVVVASVVAAAGLVVASVGVDAVGSVGLCAVGLFCYGVGTGVWDVAMNVEGAEVERRLDRSIMPRFHAAFSVGTVAAAGLGAAGSALEVPIELHVGAVALLAALVPAAAVRAFAAVPSSSGPRRPDPRHQRRSAWTEPRTVAIGLMVLTLALTEGVANDWLAVALVDGYDVPRWAGSLGFAAFVAAMTTGRVLGTPLLDRFGRTAVLWSTMALAVAGVMLVVLGHHPAWVVVGILAWGLGASLGFPVGMSAAADDPIGAPARVSVVATIGYLAFLAGPPLLGTLGDRYGVLPALLVVAVVLVPATLLVPAARREHRPAG